MTGSDVVEKKIIVCPRSILFLTAGMPASRSRLGWGAGAGYVD